MDGLMELRRVGPYMAIFMREATGQSTSWTPRRSGSRGATRWGRRPSSTASPGGALSQDDDVLVGGADFNTYVEIYATKNMIQITGDRYGGKLDHYVRPNTFEVLLARKADLVEVK
jgi:hypothetical protein